MKQASPIVQSLPLPKRGVLTMAMSKSLYFSMAINLARSFLWWHKNSDIRFYLVTDLPDELPEDLSDVTLMRVPSNRLGKGFSAKLHLDELAQTEQTLFIDADCLVVGNLERVFDRFAGRPVSVVGGSIASGEWFGDVAAVCSQFNVPSLPKFNGGIYYLEKGEISKAIYQWARELERDYDKIGLVRLRGRPNEELLMAITMALYRLEALPDDGTIMSEPYSCPAELSVNVLRGRSRLVNPPEPDSRHRAWCPFHVVHPLVVHFLGDYTSGAEYRAEAKKLQLVVARRWPIVLAEIYVMLAFLWIQRALATAKNLLRPFFHATFGPRKVPQSPRI